MSDIPVSEQQIREVRDGKRWEHGAANDAVIAAICDLALERLRTTRRPCEIEGEIGTFGGADLVDEEPEPSPAPSPSAVATSSGEGERDWITVRDHMTNLRHALKACVSQLPDRCEHERELARLALASDTLPPPAKASGAFEGVTELQSLIRDAHIDGYMKGNSVAVIYEYESRRAHAEGHAIEYVEARLDNPRHPLAEFASRLTRGYAAGWQPIETAPKTSKAILVWCPGNLCQYMVTWDGYEPNCRWVIWGGFGASLHESPTHWHPLPPAPYVSAESEGAGS